MGRSRETEDMSMSWPNMGQMTGNRTEEHHLDFYPIVTSEVEAASRAAEAVYQLAMQQIPQEVEVSQALLIYPEVESDAVTITERDMEELQPGKFLGNTIVDFYIKYLARRLSPEHRKRFYFFNSFFFTKLLQSSAATRIDPCKVDYEQLQKWTEEVNLFEKDYVFIPIVESSHWSLVILCNLSSLTRAPDEMTRFPCIVHLDPVKGQHESFEGLIRSYVLEAWMDRSQPPIDKDQLRALIQMKYIQVEVPQQQNSHDCGLYVLHYIESFLVESTSPDFSFASSERGPHFTRPHFATEVLSKRRHIQNLIFELQGISQEHAQKRKEIKHHVQELMQTSIKLQACLEDEGNFKTYNKDMLIVSPTILNEGFEINHAFVSKDPMDVQHHQSSRISRGNNEPLNGPQIGLGYETGCENLLLQQKHAELEVQTASPINCSGPIFETKHASAYEDVIDVQHQQSSEIPWSDIALLDDFELPYVDFPRVTESFSSKHSFFELEEVPCIDLSKACKGKIKRSKNMTEEDTRVLLSCKLEGGRFCKGSRGTTHWNLISEEIGKKLGSLPSPNQCRLRYDTLLKAYKTYKKYCMTTGKTFSEITEEERCDLKLATTLKEEWYTTMDEICDKAKISRKRMKLSSNICNDSLSLHDSPTPNLPPISNGRSFEDAPVVLDSACGTIEVALCNAIPSNVFNSFNEDLQSTLLNLVQECSLKDWFRTIKNGKFFGLEVVCRRLAILQDREPREILDYVFKLWKLELVNVVGMVFEEGKDLARTDLWYDKRWYVKLEVYEKISKEVLCKNPHLKTYCVSFPIEQSSLQYISVLKLIECEELEHLDLREFLKLRSLTIRLCPKLNLVTGWEVATILGSLEIGHCNAYHDFPNLQYLFSLKEISLVGHKSKKSAILWQQLSQFNQCANLRRFSICYDKIWSRVADLENLKELRFLEFLSLGGCIFSRIAGLSGLQALTTLDLHFCSLRRVPELGCLKRLTHLDMSNSSVEDVEGVGELYLLTCLDLHGCRSLRELPFLGHLKALVYLDLLETSVKEIPGSEGLISLKTLKWNTE